jgi:hypothetical protein
MKTIVESKNLKIDDSLPNQVVTDTSLNLRDTDPVSTVINQVTDQTTKITSDVTSNKYDIKKFLSEIFDVNQKLNELKIKLSFEIKDNVLNIAKLIVQNSPKSLQTISKILEDIVSDGVLNYDDIPKLILLITSLYNTEFSKLDTFKGITQKDVIEFIKFLIHSMIELELVQTNDKKKIFEMVDISLNLLETNINVMDVISAVKSNCLPLNWGNCMKKVNDQKLVDTTKLVTVISTADDVATDMTRGGTRVATRGATIVNEVIVKAEAKSWWSWPRK